MKKMRFLALFMAMAVAFSGCGTKNVPDSSAEKIPEEEIKEQIPEDTADENVVQPVENKDAMLAKYVEVLEGIFNDKKLPDGTTLDYDGYDFSDNKFAIADVDQDGKEELVINYITTSMAGMAALIYGYNEEKNRVYQELLEFPSLHFYASGLITADWSHNQGYAGDFWPYTMYHYDKTSDTYERVAMVDAWDKKIAETTYEGTTFPDDVDKDGNGMVYYVMADTYELKDPMDDASYNAWFSSYVGSTEEVTFEFLAFTEENINNLK